ncbi:MAG: RES family NAD+ phosphorylase, partial [Desulfobulbaceae bacterium]|nr:RES family NAD+ phosphorylase [Desulfobulbaceae bacterium]
MIQIELTRSTVFWRARFTEKYPWPTLSEMSYPNENNAKAGRLNHTNEPCLYAATREETAILEIGAPEESLIQLIGYRVMLETPIRIAVIGELLHVEKRGYLRITGNDPGLTVHRYLGSQSRDHGLRLLYIDAFLSQLLADPDADKTNYIRSQAVASMVYRRKAIDGIMFPSVQDQLGMNIALRPSATDSKIHAVCCLHIKIKRIRSFGFIEFDVLREAERVN